MAMLSTPLYPFVRKERE